MDNEKELFEKLIMDTLVALAKKGALVEMLTESDIEIIMERKMNDDE